MALVSMLGGVFTVIGNFFGILGDLLSALFCFLLFMPCTLILIGIMTIAYFAELVFKKVAGIDTIYLGNTAFGGANDGGQDLVYAFITEPSVQDVFWSIVALSFVLLFIFTIVALIKSEFTLDLKGSAKGPIIGRALKSFANFIIIPVVTLISVIGTNYLTKTIYDLFGTTGDSVVTKCFYIGAYNANRARLSEKFADQLKNGKDFDGKLIYEGNNPFSGKSQDQVAQLIDEYFVDGVQGAVDFGEAVTDYDYLGRVLDASGDFLDDGYVNLSLVFYGMPRSSDFSIISLPAINYYYDLTKFDFILSVGSAVCMAWILLTTCLVLIKRVFELTILFLLAPVMTAIAPLDGGQAEKKWRQEFMKRLLAVIGPIFAFNMYFLLVPLFSTISLFGSQGFIVPSIASGGTMLNSLLLIFAAFYLIFDIFFQLICIITGMSIVKSASALLSNLLGIEDLVKSGGEAGKKAVDLGKKAALGATAIGGVAVKGAAMALKSGKAIVQGFKNRGTDGGKSAKAAKGELQGAEDKVEAEQKAADSAADKVSELENQARETKAYKDNEAAIDRLQKKKEANGGVLTAEEDKKLTDMMAKRSEIISNGGGDKALKTKIKAARAVQEGRQKKLEAAQKDLGFRQSGISSDDQKKIENWEAGKDENGKQLYGKDAIAAKNKAKEFREQASKGGVRDHLKANYASEFGENAAETSTMAKATSKLTKYTKKWENTPLLNKVHELANSAKEQFAIDGSTAKRRLNDGLAGMFGDGGGGDLWKIWFNKNARAGLYEGVPESKKRTSGIEQGLSWGARDKYYKQEEEKKARDEQERLIRRMLAEQRGNKEYENLIRQRENATNPTEIKNLDAKIEKMEINTGLKDAAKEYYDNIGSGNRAAQLQSYKDKMVADAGKKAAENDYKAKAKAQSAKDAYMAESHSTTAQKTKTDAEEKSKMAEALARALEGKLKNTQLKLDKSTLQSMFEGMNFSEMADSINALIEAIGKLPSGGGNGGGNP